MKVVREYLYEKFSAESDPIQDLEIGAIHQIKDWLKNQLGEKEMKNFVINPNGVIDVKYSVTFEHIMNFPEYIQFGKVKHDFEIKDSPNFWLLRGFPEYVGNDLILRNLGKEFTEEEIRDVTEVKADVIFTDIKTHNKRKSQAKYKRLGPISKRPSPEINDMTPHLHQKYSRGYQLWKLIDFILRAGNEGVKYSELVDFDSNFKGLKSKRRTLSMGVWNMIKRHTDKDYRKTFHRYVLNNAGYNYFNKYKRYFNDGKDFSNKEEE
jgi:hypothetical protein